MSTRVEDSDRNCPHCSKRMMVDIGQDEADGWTRMVHSCWSCGYVERDEEWKRPRLVTVAASASGRTAAELLLAQRQGWVVPMVFDTSPFPKSEFEEEAASA